MSEHVQSPEPENGTIGVIAKLETEGRLNPDKTLETADGAVWIELVDEAGSKLEGKFYASPGGSGRSITIVIPGMLGDISSEIEEKHKDGLIQMGDLFVARHNGLSTKSESTQMSIHCLEKAASEYGVTGDAGKKYAPADFCAEPETAFKVFASQYETINVVSHSFGGFQVAHALGDGKLPEEVGAKVRKWVSLSGWTSPNPDSGVKFDFRSIYSQWLDHVRQTGDLSVIPSNQDFLDDMESLFSEIGQLPTGVEVVSVNPLEDEAVDVSAAENLQSLARNALLIKDATDGVVATSDMDVHAFKHLQILPRLLEMKIHGKHTVVTRDPGTRATE